MTDTARDIMFNGHRVSARTGGSGDNTEIYLSPQQGGTGGGGSGFPTTELLGGVRAWCDQISQKGGNIQANVQPRGNDYAITFTGTSRNQMDEYITQLGTFLENYHGETRAQGATAGSSQRGTTRGTGP